MSAISQKQVDQVVAIELIQLASDYEERKRQNANKGPWYPRDYTGLDRPRRQELPEGMCLGLEGYQLNGKLIPTEVLDRLERGKVCFMDCSMIYEVALYRTARKVWGDEFFNQYFGKTLRLSSDLNQTPLGKLRLAYPIEGREGERTVEVGDWCGFRNHRDYYLKFPEGAFGSHNTICIDATPHPQKFVGFGNSPQGVTEREIIEVFIAEFNATGWPITVEDLMRDGGGLLISHGRIKLSVQKLHQVFELHTKEAL